MKIFYHKGNKNPFVFEASTNEYGAIVYHFCELRDRTKQSRDISKRVYGTKIKLEKSKKIDNVEA